MLIDYTNDGVLNTENFILIEIQLVCLFLVCHTADIHVHVYVLVALHSVARNFCVKQSKHSTYRYFHHDRSNKHWGEWGGSFPSTISRLCPEVNPNSLRKLSIEGGGVEVGHE